MVLVTTTKEAMDIVRAAMDGSEDEEQEGRLAQNIKAAYATMSVRSSAGREGGRVDGCRGVSFLIHTNSDS